MVLEKVGVDQLDRSCGKRRSVTQSQGGGLTGLVTSGVGTAFWNRLLKERWNGRKDKEQDVSSYWMTLRKSEDSGN